MAAVPGQDRMLINALKNKPTVINLSNKRLSSVPPIIGRLTNLKSLILKSNNLHDLPLEISALLKVCALFDLYLCIC